MKKHARILLCVIVILSGICFLPIFSTPVRATSESEIELIKVALSHLSDDISELKTKTDALQAELNTHVQNDVSISKIEKTATNGNTDTYTITMTDETTYNFTVTNGQDGADGTDGKNGIDGIDGKDGVGISKIEKTATNGNVDTYTITMTDGTIFDFTVTNGQDGADETDVKNDIDGIDGKDGVGISKIEKTATNENVDTYTISMTDGTTYNFTVTNGEHGTSSPVGVIAIVIACISLLSNIIMTVFIGKRKKYKQ